jgi:hypothetical protein
VPLVLALLLLAACADETPGRTQPPAREAASARMQEAREAAPARMQEPREAALAPMQEARAGPASSGAAMRPPRTAALASRDPAAREQAVLDFEGDLAELAPLATGDGDASVRRAAVQRLAEGERPVERAALRAALDDADPGVVTEAILALSVLGEPTARPAFERLRTHPDPEVRALAEDGLEALRR